MLKRYLKTIIWATLIYGCSSEINENKLEDIDAITKPTVNEDTLALKSLYISPSGSDNNDGQSIDKPFKSFKKALNNLKPGSTLYVLPGEFKIENSDYCLNIKKINSGSANKYTTIKAYNPYNKPIIYSYGKGVWNAISITASYIIIDGLEIKGGNENIDRQTAYNNARNFIDGGKDWNSYAATNTNGISIGGSGTIANKNLEARPHHVIIQNCIIHDFPGSGISAIQSDWITIDNNIVYNNAWYTFYGCSGISFLTPYNFDNNTIDYKMVITNNIVYNNKTTIPWARHADKLDQDYSDGNGIIIDINNRAGAEGEANGESAYLGRTLVANNVCYFNGGTGVHIFKANNVYVSNNTTYYNSQMYESEYCEIDCNQGNNCTFINNIAFADPTKRRCSNNYGAQNCVYQNNIFFNGTVDNKWDSTNKKADPMFVELGIEPTSLFNFHLKEESPAICFGVMKDFTPTTDIEGKYRSQKNGIDCGAYQFLHE